MLRCFSFYLACTQKNSDGQLLEGNQGFKYICADKTWVTFSCGLNQASTTLANILSKHFSLPKATEEGEQTTTGSFTLGESEASMPKSVHAGGQQATRSSTLEEPQASGFLIPKPANTREQQAARGSSTEGSRESSILGDPEVICSLLSRATDFREQSVESSTSGESRTGDLPFLDVFTILTEDESAGIPVQQPAITTDQAAGGSQVSDVVSTIPLPQELAESNDEAREAGSLLICFCPFCNEQIEPSDQCTVLTTRGVEGIQDAAKRREDENLNVFVNQKVHTVCRQKYNDPRRIAQFVKQKNKKARSESPSLRSTVASFDFKSACFFCGFSILAKDDVSHCRTIGLRETILAKCGERQDPWSNQIKHRVQNVHDLHAADAIYHRQCHRNFMSNLNLPSRYEPEEQLSKRPKVERGNVLHGIEDDNQGWNFPQTESEPLKSKYEDIYL